MSKDSSNLEFAASGGLTPNPRAAITPDGNCVFRPGSISPSTSKRPAGTAKPSRPEAPNWQRQRAEWLGRILAGLDRSRANGLPLRRAARRAAVRWSGRTYVDGRPVRFSAQTLTATYYRWLRNGKAAEAYRLRFNAPVRAVPAELLREFVSLNLQPGVNSMSEAFRRLNRAWLSGAEVPGLGTWAAWAQARGLELEAAPRFPFRMDLFVVSLGSASRKVLGDCHAAMFCAQRARRLLVKGFGLVQQE
jgi:hypothetical protein